MCWTWVMGWLTVCKLPVSQNTHVEVFRVPTPIQLRRKWASLWQSTCGNTSTSRFKFCSVQWCPMQRGGSAPLATSWPVPRSRSCVEATSLSNDWKTQEDYFTISFWDRESCLVIFMAWFERFCCSIVLILFRKLCCFRCFRCFIIDSNHGTMKKIIKPKYGWLDLWHSLVSLQNLQIRGLTMYVQSQFERMYPQPVVHHKGLSQAWTAYAAVACDHGPNVPWSRKRDQRNRERLLELSDTNH